jgi:hypothetical protein
MPDLTEAHESFCNVAFPIVTKLPKETKMPSRPTTRDLTTLQNGTHPGSRRNHTAVRSLRALVLIGALIGAVNAQDQRDWQSLAKLQAGDRLRLSLKTGSSDGLFQTWTPEDVKVGSMTSKKEDVFKIERFRPGSHGRGKHAAIGALIGFGGGFIVGAAVGNCRQGELLCPKAPRVVFGVGFGFLGVVVGGAIGVLLPSHNKDLIYSSR